MDASWLSVHRSWPAWPSSRPLPRYQHLTHLEKENSPFRCIEAVARNSIIPEIAQPGRMITEEDFCRKHPWLEMAYLLRDLNLEMNAGDNRNIAPQEGSSAMISITNVVPILILDDLQVARVFREKKWEHSSTHQRHTFFEGYSRWHQRLLRSKHGRANLMPGGEAKVRVERLEQVSAFRQFQCEFLRTDQLSR